MQKPDADGYVTITWPSKNIPHGGIFHTRVANPSYGQRELLKVLLEESKLTLTQNQKNAYLLRQQDDTKPTHQPQSRKLLIRPRTSRRRSLSEIRSSGAYDYGGYQPLKRGQDREQMKEKLANTMTYGDAEEQPKPMIISTKKKGPPKLPTNKEKWNELVTQIRERTEWLAEMEYLGHGAAHRDIIGDQIAERMRALDALGVDSECSTARSTASGFSILRSNEPLQKPPSAAPSRHSSTRSDKNVKKQSVRTSGREGKKEENVASYSQLSLLQKSPRRRQ
ncbi:unnamed protein product [Arctia plantaginis]|uniref:Uncharacterized protein n=1 Tax=Arctia plantaginis TaxID=874455 RepID=A0A8S1B323_ARCPL|nr:unnamed protein product [Arctia plantaginis]CAB3253875.1 unnamed protein product [Arctia plantaginis]